MAEGWRNVSEIIAGIAPHRPDNQFGIPILQSNILYIKEKI
jgi:hypothetical protein